MGRKGNEPLYGWLIIIVHPRCSLLAAAFGRGLIEPRDTSMIRPLLEHPSQVLRDRKGVSAIEYALMVALIAVAIAPAVRFLGLKLAYLASMAPLLFSP